ncbi:MAG: serine/threonine-protein kinase [Dermatophilaceae bacterium]
MRGAPPAPHIPGYHYVRVLSDRGGFGDVYLYEEAALARQVAIKVIRDPDLDDATLASFRAEATTMAALEHPNVVRIYAIGQTDEGRPYISMMYCSKENMAERSAGGGMPLHEVLEIAVAIAGAVESAHGVGILHRDIKPANILTMPWGAPGLTDFGVASSLSAETEDEDVGVSIPWSPPEMLFTNTRGSRATDVYSLAATVWHLLVGRSPFEVVGGDNSRMALMTRIGDAPPPATGRGDTPASLERTLRRALAKDPAMRPQTVAEFARALQSVQLELRLARAPFIVLDRLRPGQAGTAGLRPDARPDDAADRTRRRSSAPATTPDTLSTSSSVQRVDPLGSTGQRGETGRDGVRITDLESVTDTSTGRSVKRPTPAAGPERTLGTGVLVSGAAVVAAAALGLGYVAFGRGGDHPATPPRVTASSADIGLGVPVTAPSRPDVIAKRLDAAHARFTWTYDHPQQGDGFLVQIVDAEGVVTATEEPDAPSITLPGKAKQEICVQVAVRRPGSSSAMAYSRKTCVTL